MVVFLAGAAGVCASGEVYVAKVLTASASTSPCTTENPTDPSTTCVVATVRHKMD